MKLQMLRREVVRGRAGSRSSTRVQGPVGVGQAPLQSLLDVSVLLPARLGQEILETWVCLERRVTPQQRLIKVLLVSHHLLLRFTLCWCLRLRMRG
jgi:hypothetical protein